MGINMEGNNKAATAVRITCKKRGGHLEGTMDLRVEVVRGRQEVEGEEEAGKEK
jgi:hypothetical protein